MKWYQNYVILMLFFLFSPLITNAEENYVYWVSYFTVPIEKVVPKAYAESLSPKEIVKNYVDVLINQYDLDSKMFHFVIEGESGYNPNARGDTGKAVGPAQFHYETFYRMRKKAGMLTAIRTNWQDNLDVAGWIFGNGTEAERNEWTCHRRWKAGWKTCHIR